MVLLFFKNNRIFRYDIYDCSKTILSNNISSCFSSFFNGSSLVDCHDLGACKIFFLPQIKKKQTNSFFQSGQVWFGPVMNSIVHVLMYAYYGLSVIPSLREKLWWKRYITIFQLVKIIKQNFN